MTPEYFANFQLPNRCHCVQGDEGAWWDVKFYPYLDAPDDPAIFAIVATWGFSIFQAQNEPTQLVEQLFTYRFKDDVRPTSSAERIESVELNACAWCYAQRDQPLLAIAGQNGLIRLYDPFTGSVVSSLIGHGTGTINDLASHPKYPWIIASASLDGSVRIWDVRRMHEKTESATIIICGHGMAHKDGLLSIGWHDSGRYLVSSGFDHNVCVWVLPDLKPTSDFWHSISKEGRKRSADAVKVIHYPHFISSALHNDYVDKVMFVKDFVLSKSACSDQRRLNTIAMWSISGFNSNLEPPNDLTAPKAQEWLDTRNGFMRRHILSADDDTAQSMNPEYQYAPLYTRHFEFQIRHTGGFYMRFGLSQPSAMFPDVHHVLCMGNSKSDVFFWDLDRFIYGHDGSQDIKKKSTRHPDHHTILNKSIRQIQHSDSTESSRRSSPAETAADRSARDSSTAATNLSIDDNDVAVEDMDADRQTYALDDPYRQFPPHNSIKIKTPDGAEKNYYFMSLGSAWSNCGRWCVVSGFIGSRGSLALCYRRV